ncbi:MAG: hypothetical protein U5K81_03180 [Trueperaceae bacterium]|nr:hypothetical protein [Trueperaceae bacterium]
MEEERVRYPSGRTGERNVHRVGLTRHCITSGTIQLPFALKDAFPEGEFVAHDVHRDQAITLDFEPPRRLHGLRDLFEAHELHVNDLLEIRVEADTVRLAAVQLARYDARSRDDQAAAVRPSRTADPHRAARPRHPEARAEPDASHLGDDVVDRFGSVTVRRLGAGTARPPAAETLSDDAPRAERPEEPSALQAPNDDRSVQESAPVELYEPAAAPERDAGPLPPASSPSRPSGAPEVAQASHRTAPQAAPAEAGEARVTPHDLAEPEADDAQAEDGDKRLREESLSRAGDLRSRIVRWLLDPSTPVIVQYQHVMHAFDLPREVVHDVMAGIIEEPPPTLRLAELREGMFRVSKVTVEQEA